MDKKKTKKSKAARSMRDLPAKKVDARTAKAVKGGESITFVYSKPEKEYKTQ